MRKIDVDIDVFALIWAHRKPPESTENAILMRILSSLDGPRMGVQAPVPAKPSDRLEVFSSNPKEVEGMSEAIAYGKTRWVDDVRAALSQLGGAASLHKIYKVVEDRRKSAGRSIPKTLEATIRRTIEDHSSDSENFRGPDLFVRVARGEWAIRPSQT